MAKREEKHKRLQEISHSFGMDISEFCKCIGYSRQMLYQASCGMSNMNPGRLAVAIYKLEVLNEKILEKDIEMAKEEHNKRCRLLSELERRLR